LSDVRKSKILKNRYQEKIKSKEIAKDQLLAALNCTASPDALFFTVWDKAKPL